MRELIYYALQHSGELATIMPSDVPNPPGPVRAYQWGSLGTVNSSKPTFPFILINEQPLRTHKEVAETAPGAQTRTFFIYCYDQHGEGYLRIEQVLRIVRDTLLPLIGQRSPSGALCVDVKWTGWSVDSRDPEYVANMKWATFTMTTNQ